MIPRTFWYENSNSFHLHQDISPGLAKIFVQQLKQGPIVLSKVFKENFETSYLVITVYHFFPLILWSNETCIAQIDHYSLTKGTSFITIESLIGSGSSPTQYVRIQVRSTGCAEGFASRRTCVMPSAGGRNGFVPGRLVLDAGSSRSLQGFRTLASKWKLGISSRPWLIVEITITVTSGLGWSLAKLSVIWRPSFSLSTVREGSRLGWILSRSITISASDLNSGLDLGASTDTGSAGADGIGTGTSTIGVTGFNTLSSSSLEGISLGCKTSSDDDFTLDCERRVDFIPLTKKSRSGSVLIPLVVSSLVLLVLELEGFWFVSIFEGTDLKDDEQF